MTSEQAEILALQALGWLAGEPDSIQRFLNLSGISAADLRDAAGEPGTALAVLDFLLGHEDLLIQFCDSAEVQARQVHAARHALGRDAVLD